MSYQPAVDDYVTARAKNGDHLTGTVSTLYPGDSEDYVEICCGGTNWILHPEDGWTFELTERPETPLADGVYQKHGAIRMRSEGRWFVSKWEPYALGSDSIHSDWGYVGPEVSQ